MPELTLTIGGRSYRVACETGQEDRLREAGRLIDTEAEALTSALGPVPESRMLLMAGLMLADRMITETGKTVATEKIVRDLRHQLREAQGTAKPTPAAPLPEKGQQTLFSDPKVAAEAVVLLQRTAARLEALAGDLEAAEQG